MMSRKVSMVIDGGKGPADHHTLVGNTLPVDYPAFLCDVVPILGGLQEILDGIASFKMDLDPPPFHIHS